MRPRALSTALALLVFGCEPGPRDLLRGGEIKSIRYSPAGEAGRDRVGTEETTAQLTAPLVLARPYNEKGQPKAMFVGTLRVVAHDNTELILSLYDTKGHGCWFATERGKYAIDCKRLKTVIDSMEPAK